MDSGGFRSSRKEVLFWEGDNQGVDFQDMNHDAYFVLLVSMYMRMKKPYQQWRQVTNTFFWGANFLKGKFFMTI